MRGASHHIRLVIGWGTSRTGAASWTRVNTGEKGTLSKGWIMCSLVVKPVPGGIGITPCHPQGLPQGISHIISTFAFQRFNNKILDMHTARLSAIVTVMICKGYGVGVICYVDAVDICILIYSARGWVVTRSHDHRTCIFGHFYSAMWQVNQTIWGATLSGKPGVRLFILGMAQRRLDSSSQSVTGQNVRRVIYSRPSNCTELEYGSLATARSTVSPLREK